MNTLRKFLMFAVVASCLALGFGLQTSTAEAGGPDPVVIFETTMGRIIVILRPREAPVTVENFLKYVDAGFYDGTVFHRIIQQEKAKKSGDDLTINIVQGGGFTYPLQPKATMRPIICESRKAMLNKKGTIAMARGADPASATSQFFFNVEDNPVLDYSREPDKWDPEKYDVITGYCAFGKILRGMEIVEKMLHVKTARNGIMEDVPVTPIYITKAYRAK